MICVVTKLRILSILDSKRNEAEVILDNLLSSYWLRVIGTIISGSNLSTS